LRRHSFVLVTIKNKIMKNVIRAGSMVFIVVFFCNCILGQCGDQVTHKLGIKDINGVETTVTPHGGSDTTSWCLDANPYIIGYSGDFTNPSDGSYKFQFSPAIDSLTINFAAIHGGPVNKEIVKIEVNGNHYVIPNVGSPNSCSDSLAVITSTGDLTGNSNGEDYTTSSCNGITISGSINELIIENIIIGGNPNGVLFSLFICQNIISSNFENLMSNILISPIPARDRIIIKGLKDSSVKMRLINNFGKTYGVKSTFYVNEEMLIDVSGIPSGLYFLTLETNNAAEVRKIIIL